MLKLKTLLKLIRVQLDIAVHRRRANVHRVFNLHNLRDQRLMLLEVHHRRVLNLYPTFVLHLHQLNLPCFRSTTPDVVQGKVLDSMVTFEIAIVALTYKLNRCFDLHIAET